MDSYFVCDQLTITGNQGKQLIQFEARATEGDLTETVSVAVIIPAENSRSLSEIHKLALDRAIAILQQLYP